MTAFYQLLKQYPLGIESNLIQEKISQIIQSNFELKHYSCHTLYEFINKFLIKTIDIDIIQNKPDSFILRSKQIYQHVQKQQQQNSHHYQKGSVSSNHSSSTIDQQKQSIQQIPCFYPQVSPQNMMNKQLNNQQHLRRQTTSMVNNNQQFYPTYPGALPSNLPLDNPYYHQMQQLSQLQQMQQQQYYQTQIQQQQQL